MNGASQIAVLTRPAGRNADVMHALSRRGWDVHEFPALEIHSSPVLTVSEVPDPGAFDLVVFVSRAAVNGYTKQLGSSFVWPSRVLVACMGPTTALAIKRTWSDIAHVVHPDADHARDSEALWPLLKELTIPIRSVLIVRGQDGRDWLANRLYETGVSVLIHQAYERVYAQWSESIVTQLNQWADMSSQVVWLLTSAHGISAVVEQVQRLGLLDWFRVGQFVLTHERLVSVLAKAIGVDPGALRFHLSQPEDANIVLCFDQILGATKQT